MSIRAIGIILVWLGTLLLVAVLQYRIRQGAWSEEGLEATPPIARWAVGLAVVGMIAAAAGIVLTVWSFA